jgi:hypothetical protein
LWNQILEWRSKSLLELGKRKIYERGTLYMYFLWRNFYNPGCFHTNKDSNHLVKEVLIGKKLPLVSYNHGPNNIVSSTCALTLKSKYLSSCTKIPTRRKSNQI